MESERERNIPTKQDCFSSLMCKAVQLKAHTQEQDPGHEVLSNRGGCQRLKQTGDLDACGSTSGVSTWCRSAGTIASLTACSALQARTSELSTGSFKAWGRGPSAAGLETQAVSIGQDRKARAQSDWVGLVLAWLRVSSRRVMRTCGESKHRAGPLLLPKSTAR